MFKQILQTTSTTKMFGLIIFGRYASDKNLLDDYFSNTVRTYTPAEAIQYVKNVKFMKQFYLERQVLSKGFILCRSRLLVKNSSRLTLGTQSFSRNPFSKTLLCVKYLKLE